MMEQTLTESEIRTLYEKKQAEPFPARKNWLDVQCPAGTDFPATTHESLGYVCIQIKIIFIIILPFADDRYFRIKYASGSPVRSLSVYMQYGYGTICGIKLRTEF